MTAAKLEGPRDSDDRIVFEARGLKLGYGGRAVLRDVEWTVRRGERWFLLGPNGTGKTTLLKAILGVRKPLGGRLVLAPDLSSGRRIGFVPQRCDFKATLPLTVADYVRLGLTRTGIRRGRARENLRRALDEVGLLAMGETDYWSLSGGQRQRALVARALVREPDLLILDEPTNGLDLPAEESFLELVARLNRERGITVLLVTHTVGLAPRYASHVALIRQGVVLTGSTESVLTGANLQAAYGVEVSISFDGAHRPAVRIGGEHDEARS